MDSKDGILEMPEDIGEVMRQWLEQPVAVSLSDKSLAYAGSVIHELESDDLAALLASVKRRYLETGSSVIAEKIIDDTMNFVLFLMDKRFDEYVSSEPMQSELREKLGSEYDIYGVDDIMNNVPGVYDMLKDVIAGWTYLVDVPISMIKEYHSRLKDSYDWRIEQITKKNRYLCDVVLFNCANEGSYNAAAVVKPDDRFKDPVLIAAFLLTQPTLQILMRPQAGV